MAHTYTNLLLHVVFSTKNRQRILSRDLLPELARFIGGIMRNRRGRLLHLGGMEDHVHLLGLFAVSAAISDQIRDIKAVSSRWIHEKSTLWRAFAWQGGYSAFSVSASGCDQVALYINSQAVHHAKMTFEEELMKLLERHGVEYDPRYVFD